MYYPPIPLVGFRFLTKHYHQMIESRLNSYLQYAINQQKIY